MGSNLRLKRSNSSAYELKDDMKPYFMSTLYCNWRLEKEPSYQFLHREVAWCLIEAKKSAAKTKTTISLEKETIIFTLAEMCELNITTMSVKLRLFNDVCKGMNKDNLVSPSEDYCDAAFDGFQFPRFICIKLKPTLPTTGAEDLEFICEGSPFLRNLIHLICHNEDFLRPRKEGKFLFGEDVLLNVMFLECGLNMLSVDVAVDHSGTTNAERSALQGEFNNLESKLSGMIPIYDTGGTSLNL